MRYSKIQDKHDCAGQDLHPDGVIPPGGQMIPFGPPRSLTGYGNKTPDDCERRCDEMDACIGFSHNGEHNRQNGKCYLKSSLANGTDILNCAKPSDGGWTFYYKPLGESATPRTVIPNTSPPVIPNTSPPVLSLIHI